MYRYDFGSYDVESLLSFSSSWYKNVKGERVPMEQTWFDKTTDHIVRYLKQQEINLSYVYIGLGSTLSLLILVIFYCKCLKKKSIKKYSTRFSLESKEYYKLE